MVPTLAPHLVQKIPPWHLYLKVHLFGQSTNTVTMNTITATKTAETMASSSISTNAAAMGSMEPGSFLVGILFVFGALGI